MGEDHGRDGMDLVFAVNFCVMVEAKYPHGDRTTSRGVLPFQLGL